MSQTHGKADGQGSTPIKTTKKCQKNTNDIKDVVLSFLNAFDSYTMFFDVF